MSTAEDNRFCKDGEFKARGDFYPRTDKFIILVFNLDPNSPAPKNVADVPNKNYDLIPTGQIDSREKGLQHLAECRSYATNDPRRQYFLYDANGPVEETEPATTTGA